MSFFFKRLRHLVTLLNSDFWKDCYLSNQPHIFKKLPNKKSISSGFFFAKFLHITKFNITETRRRWQSGYFFTNKLCCLMTHWSDFCCNTITTYFQDCSCKNQAICGLCAFCLHLFYCFYCMYSTQKIPSSHHVLYNVTYKIHI